MKTGQTMADNKEALYRIADSILDLSVALIAALDSITPEEDEILFSRFVKSATLEEVASSRGKSREEVRQLEVRALKKLRKRILENLTT